MTIDSSNLGFIIAAYAVTWTILLGYLGRLVRKGARARADYERMVREQSGGESQ